MKVGISYHPALHDLIVRARDEQLVDALEIHPERYIFSESGGTYLSRLLADLGLPYSFHFACSSIASADFCIDDSALTRQDIVAKLRPQYCSDHLTSCRIEELDLEKNLPTPHTPEALAVLVENLVLLQQDLDAPFLLENIATMWGLACSTMSQSQFLGAAVEAADCGILLDLHNLYADELNHTVCAREAMDELPLARVREVHVAGGSWKDGFYYDGHDHDVCDETFELLTHLLHRATPELVVLEREARFADLDGIWRDLSTLQRICRQ